MMMGVQAPEAGQETTASSNLETEWYCYVFKVQPCPKRGAHDWSSCPYAHPKEKARRRDPRLYKYASTPCPESLQGVNCGRGVDCPYAHSVYEYWLHPARFRTQMCKKGNQCNRTLCFFAHSASELRFPDTEDEAEAAAVDAAAASATAAPLPLYNSAMVGSSNTNSGSMPQVGGMAIMQPVAGSSNASLPLMQIGSVCSDASAATAAMGALDGSSSSYSMAALQAAAGIRQGSGGSQLTGIVDDMSGSYGLGGSDPGLLLQGLASQQQQQAAQGQSGANSLSEPLPRLSSDPNSMNTAAWLQLATASQLPASQILSSIRPPGAATVAAAQQQQQLQQQRQMMQQAAAYGGQRPPLGGMAASSSGGMMLMGGGSGSSSHPLVAVGRMDSSADQLVASLGGLQLQGGGSGSHQLTSASTAALADRYAALSAAAGAGRSVDASMLQGAMPAGNSMGPQGVSSSRAEDFLLLQLLQEKQVQQQQQQQIARMSSGGGGMGGMGGGHNMAAAQFNQASMPMSAPQQAGKLNWGFGCGI